MASNACLRHLRRLAGLSNGPQQCNAALKRTMATVSEPATEPLTAIISPVPDAQPASQVLTTIYQFPQMEPLRFAYYPQNHLHLPLRRDLLHKAVIYEGDKTRQGTASTKWRDDVHGTHKKLYPQKGLGKARVGDKQSPIRRGGGVAFGPKPRDFSTKLNKKMYDLAWRTALSYRYRRGELVVVDAIKNLESSGAHWIKEVFSKNRWGSEHKRSLLVAGEKNRDNRHLFDGMTAASEHGTILELADVDVKDLLELGRVVIEHEALNKMLRRHCSDLVASVPVLNDEPELSLQDLSVS